MQTKEAPQPRYKNMHFKSVSAFNAWLDTTAKKVIWLKDSGQKVTMIWIDARGEILNVDAQAHIYGGMFIDTNTLEVGKNVQIYWPLEGFQTMNSMIVESIDHL